MNTIVLVIIVVMFFVAYQLIVRRNYRLLVGYNFKSDNERYPKKIEEKMCIHIGMSAMILGIAILLLVMISKSAMKGIISGHNILFGGVATISTMTGIIKYRIKKNLDNYNRENDEKGIVVKQF